MPLELLDVVENVDWKELRPRKSRRRSLFLRPPTEPESTQPSDGTFLCLPPAAFVNVGQTATQQAGVQHAAMPLSQSIVRRIWRALPSTPYRWACGWMYNPAVIIGYIHVLLNMAVLLSVLYIAGYTLYFLTVDTLYKISLRKEEVRVAIEEARRLYGINRCDPSTRVPALESQCGEWDCMIRNGFAGIRYTKIIIEMCAELVDGFVSRFSLKSYGLLGGFLVLYLLFRK